MTVYVQYQWDNNDEDIEYPEINTLWNNADTSIAKESNNYRVSHAWDDEHGIAFKINTDNIAVNSVEQVFNVMYVHVEYIPPEEEENDG